MNDQEFEDRLRALTGTLRRPDPTAEWKTEILARARTRATVHTPRWLVLGLSTAWLCIVVLRIATPNTSGLQGFVAGVDSHEVDSQENAPADLRHPADTPLRTLLALQSNPEFPDLP
jgi:hypothetical protein